MKKILLILVSVLFFNLLLIGQEKNIDKALEYYNANEYKEAIPFFLMHKDYNNDLDILMKIGYSYSKIHNPSSSVLYYEKAKLIKWPFDYVHMLDYANVLRQLKEYKKAKAVYNVLARTPSKMIESCDWVKQANSINHQIVLDSLPLDNEYSINGFWKFNNDILFPASGSDMNNSFKWYNVETKKISNFLKYDWQYHLNSPNIIGDSVIIYSASSSKEIFFSKKVLKKKLISSSKENKLNIWKLNLNSKEEATKLSFINIDYGYLHPYFDSSSDKLYFVSDMPGGYGGYDIYSVEKKNGIWTKPVNAGSNINTEYDEAYPYVKNNIMFFSSKGHLGYGGFDIFMIDYKDNKAQSINMGLPFNSSKDDFSYREDSHNSGCFVSNRNNKANRDFLWMFKRNKSNDIINCDLLKNNKRNIQIKDSSLLFDDYLMGDKFEVKNDILLGEIDDLNSKGGPLIIGLISSEKNKHIDNSILSIPKSAVKRKNYKDYMLRYELPKDSLDMSFVYYRDSCVVVMNRNILEAEIKVLVDNDGKKEVRNSYLIKKQTDYLTFNYLYFDFDSSNLIYSSIKELRSIVVFLEKYPHLKLNLTGYTDKFGSRRYNLGLSRKRARKVYSFFNINGVPRSRVSFVGKGKKYLKGPHRKEYSRARLVMFRFNK